MPSNKFQYSQRINLIEEISKKMISDKVKFNHLTDFCKSIANMVSIKELEAYIDKPEDFKSKPKNIAYQTLLTNKDYKIIIEDAYNLIINKEPNKKKSIDFEKDLEISNLKDKIRRLESFIQNSSNINTNNKEIPSNSQELENAYKLINILTSQFNDFISIDIEHNKILNLVDLPVSLIADGNLSKGFIEFLRKNNLTND